MEVNKLALRRLMACVSSLMRVGQQTHILTTARNHSYQLSRCPRRLMSTSSSIPNKWQHDIPVSLKSTVDGQTDIQSTVKVIDTDISASANKPLVLGIHGVPGKGEDFEPLITELDKNGVRVVAPTFIGFEGSLLETWQLNHVDFSTVGRSIFLQMILDQMGIDRVDMVLTHSAGTWLGYKIMAEWDHVRSAGLLNPVGARPHKMLRPYVGTQSVAALLRVKPLLPLLLPLMGKIYNSIGFVGVQAGTQLCASQQVVANQQFYNVADHAEKIAKKKLPLFIAHSQTDKVVEWEVSEEIVKKHLKLPPENIVAISRNRESTVDPIEVFLDDWLARALLFESGGHLVHKSYSEIVLKQILSILDHLNIQSS